MREKKNQEKRERIEIIVVAVIFFLINVDTLFCNLHLTSHGG